MSRWTESALRNATDAELIKAGIDSDDPLAAELARRLEEANEDLRHGEDFSDF